MTNIGKNSAICFLATCTQLVDIRKFEAFYIQIKFNMKKELKNIQTFEQHTDKNLNISDVSDSKIQKVKAIKDESGHWYVIPNDLVNEFRKDEQDEDFVDSDDFDNKYGKYRTGGDLNLVQLYAVI